MQTVRAVVDFFASISLVISLITLYLSWNKTWGVKHERAVAESVSLSSNLIYLIPSLFATLNEAWSGITWQTGVEYVIGYLDIAFFMLIGLGWWVAGERQKGVGRLLRENLRTERQRLGDLARAFIRPASAGTILDLLTHLALIDETLETKEKKFIQAFAEAWSLQLDWEALARRPRPSGPAKYAHLRQYVSQYLATTPPPKQALQLADIVTKLVRADDQVTEAETLIVSELTGLLERYAGTNGQIVYEVHLVPLNQAQAEAMALAFPQMDRRALHGGEVWVAGSYFSRPYAELLRRQYLELNFYTAVVEILPHP
jgi:hypothetical protein